MTTPTTVLVFDAQRICKLALLHLLAQAGERFAIAGETADPAEAVLLAAERRPQLVIVGVGTTEDCAVIARIHTTAPDAQIVALSSGEDGRLVFEAVRAGAVGFIPRVAEPADVLSALTRAAAGRPVLDPAAATEGLLWVARWLSGPTERPRGIARLTQRESEMLALLAEGLDPSEIARRVFLSRRTVEFHLTNVYRKLGVRGRIEAIGELVRWRAGQGVQDLATLGEAGRRVPQPARAVS